MKVWTLMLRSWRPKGKYHDEKNNSREDRELGSGAGHNSLYNPPSHLLPLSNSIFITQVLNPDPSTHL